LGDPPECSVMTRGRSGKKIRVVTLVDGIGTGGGEQLAAQTTALLDPDRFDRTICVTREASAEESPEYIRATAETLRAAEVRIVQLTRRSTADVYAWLPLLQLLRRERVDVLHAHKFGANVWAAILGRLAHVPVIVAHEHSWSFKGKPLRRLLDRELADVAVCDPHAATPTQPLTEAVQDADVVIVPPSNPVVSVGTILAVPGVRDAVRTTAARVVGVSPLIAGHHVRGMADQLLAAIGVEVGSAAVARLYGARPGGVLDGWLVDSVDAGLVEEVRGLGIACEAVPLLMTDHDATAAMVRAAFDLVDL